MSIDLKTFNAINDPKKLHVNGVNGPCLFSNISCFDHDPYSFVSCTSHDMFEKIIPEFINTLIARMDHDKLINSKEIYDTLHNFVYNSHDKQNLINFLSSLFSMSASQERMFC